MWIAPSYSVTAAAREVHFGDDVLLAVGAIDHDEVAIGNGAQRHGAGRVAVRHPLPALPLAVQHAVLSQQFQPRRGVDRAEACTAGERQLERSAADVIKQDQGLIGCDARMFRRGITEKFRVAHEVLIQRIGAGHQHPSDDCCRRPARPKRCQVPATEPG